MFTFQGDFPTRIQEEIKIYNMSLPLPIDVPPNDQQENQSRIDYNYEPLLGELLKSAECPVCRCIPSPPIYNCVNGHVTCNSCLVRLPSGKCGYCLAKFTKMRNFPLENLVSVRTFSCDFKGAGCASQNMPMAEYEEHVRTCKFRPIPVLIKPPQAREILQSKNCNILLEPTADTDQQSTCPKCRFSNPKRKLKCQNCQLNLRTPTPMCGRHVLGSPAN